MNLKLTLCFPLFSPFISIFLLTACSEKINQEKPLTSFSNDSSFHNSTKLNGYDELANDEDRMTFTVSEFNTDIESVPNINRPKVSSITNFKFPKENIFGIWVQNPSKETPHATFSIDDSSFFVVDYDGDGSMPFEINYDSLSVYFNDFIQKGKILRANSNDTLIIQWTNSNKPTTYYKWKN